MEYPREPKFYPNNEEFSIYPSGEAVKTLQSIDGTLKRIETILRSQNQCVALDVQVPFQQKSIKN